MANDNVDMLVDVSSRFVSRAWFRPTAVPWLCELDPGLPAQPLQRQQRERDALFLLLVPG